MPILAAHQFFLSTGYGQSLWAYACNAHQKLVESLPFTRSDQMGENGELKALIEGDDGISVLRGGGQNRNWNGIHYKTGLSAKNVSAKELSINVATIPPGGVAYAHIHVEFEVMLRRIIILEGDLSQSFRHEYGDGCKQIVDNSAGDFIFIQRAARDPARGLQSQR